MKLFKHGCSGYSKHGCRCSTCRLEKKKYRSRPEVRLMQNHYNFKYNHSALGIATNNKRAGNKPKWRVKNKPGYSYKIYARTIVYRALKSGRLIKPKHCRKCKNTRVQAHHVDYLQPLKVIWLCSKHHMKLHTQMVL